MPLFVIWLIGYTARRASSVKCLTTGLAVHFLCRSHRLCGGKLALACAFTSTLAPPDNFLFYWRPTLIYHPGTGTIGSYDTADVKSYHIAGIISPLRDNSVYKAKCLQAILSVLHARKSQNYFLVFTSSKLTQGHNQPLVKLVPWLLPWRRKCNVPMF